MRFLFEDSALPTAAHPSIPIPQLLPASKIEGAVDECMDEQENNERSREKHSRVAA
jgi:hypothetical protein